MDGNSYKCIIDKRNGSDISTLVTNSNVTYDVTDPHSEFYVSNWSKQHLKKLENKCLKEFLH